MAQVTLASGTGKTLRKNVASLSKIEQAQPKGTRLALRSSWKTVHVPGVGTLHPGGLMASAVNEAYRARKIVSGGHTIPLWPGDKLPATYDRTTRTLTIRWRTASAFLDVLVTVLAGVAAGGIAVWLGLPLGAAAVVAVAAAFGAGFAIVIDYMLSWAFLGPSSGVANPGLGTIIFVAGLGVLLVGVLRSKPSI